MPRPASACRRPRRASTWRTSRNASASSRPSRPAWNYDHAAPGSRLVRLGAGDPAGARCYRARMSLPELADIYEDYAFLEGDDRIAYLIDLGRGLDPMPEALKTDATKVRGCSASVWVYPTAEDGRLHFLADSNAAITKGIVALILSAVQDKPAAEVAKMDVTEALARFELRKHLSANRTQGVPNMIALVRQTAERYAAA